MVIDGFSSPQIAVDSGVPRPTLQNVIFHSILDDFLNIRVLSSHFQTTGNDFPKDKSGGGGGGANL